MALGLGGTVVARARAVLEADTKNLDRGLDKSEAKWKKWNRVAVAGAVGVGVAVAKASKVAIDAASDLREEVNKTTVVFGDQSKQILRWSQNSAKGFGASRRAALQYAGGFGAMFRSIGGIADKEMARMSTKLVELGGDLASFYNADTADALEAMKSALSGQIEPMRRFGVFLTQDRIKAQALSMGLVKATVDMDAVKQKQEQIAIASMKLTKAQKEHGKGSVEARSASLQLQKAEFGLKKLLDGKVGTVSAAAKAQATYAIIQKDTAVAHGDFARTADGAANKQRILAAQIEDTKAKLGMGLLPMYEKALGLTSDLVTWGQKHSVIVKVLAGVLVGLSAAVLAVNAAWKVYIATQRLVALVSAANPIVLITAAIVALGVALVVAYKKSETFRKIVHAVFDAVKKVAAGAVGLILRYFEFWLTAMAKIARAASHLPLVGDKFKGVAEKVERARDGLQDMRKKIEALPTKKKVDVEVGFLVGNKRYGGGTDRAGDGVVGAFDSAVMGGIRGLPAPVFAAANPGGLSPFILDELGLAQSFGLGLTSGFRPGSITSTGNRSLHSTGNAIDVAGSAGSMAAFAKAVAGRPGVAEVIYTPVGAWYPGAGWVRPTGSVARDHFDHVHVGVRGGGTLSIGGGFSTSTGPRRGDGLLGHGSAGYSRPAKPKARKKTSIPKWRALLSRYAKSKTGEASVDRLIDLYNRKDGERSNLERNYSVTESELAMNDRDLIVTRTAVDPVTGQSYEYEEVDFGAVQQEKDDQDVLIALQGRIREKVVEMETLARSIRSRIAEVVKRLRAAISKALAGGSREEASRNRWTAEAGRIRKRVDDLKGRLAAERKKKKPSKAVIADLEGEIEKNEKSLRRAEVEAKAAEGRRAGFERDRKLFEERKGAAEQSGGEFEQKVADLGFDRREIDVRLGQLQKGKDAIVGTKAEPFDLDEFRRANAPETDTGSGTGSTSTGGGSATAAEIAAQLATQTDAVIAARGRFVSEFGSNVFARALTAAGARVSEGGAAAPRQVTVVQQFTRQPEDPFVWLKKSEFAAETVFGS